MGDKHKSKGIFVKILINEKAQVYLKIFEDSLNSCKTLIQDKLIGIEKKVEEYTHENHGIRIIFEGLSLISKYTNIEIRLLELLPLQHVQDIQ